MTHKADTMEISKDQSRLPPLSTKYYAHCKLPIARGRDGWVSSEGNFAVD